MVAALFFSKRFVVPVVHWLKGHATVCFPEDESLGRSGNQTVTGRALKQCFYSIGRHFAPPDLHEGGCHAADHVPEETLP